MLTKTNGFFIINKGAIALDPGVTQVAYPDDAVLQEFTSEAEMLAAHISAYPEQYPSEENTDLGVIRRGKESRIGQVN